MLININQDKNKRIVFVIKNAFSGLIAKIINVIVSILTIPLVLNYLGVDNYGVWALVSSLVLIMQVFDLGIGNGLITICAREFSNGKSLENRGLSNIFMTALTLMLFAALALWVISVLIVNSDVFPMLVKISDENIYRLTKDSIFIFITLFCLNMPISVCQPFRMGMQDKYTNAVYNSTGQFINLLSLYIAIINKCTVPELIISSMVGTLLLNFINTLTLLLKINNKLTYPTLHSFIAISKNIFNSGPFFFVMQLTTIFSYNLDNFILARYSNISDVTSFSIVMKIFTVPLMLISLIFYGLWAVYPEAIEKKDFIWVKNIFKKSLIQGFIFNLVASIFLLIFAEKIIELIANGLVINNYMLFSGMVCWCCLMALIGACSSLLNGLDSVRFQSITFIFGAIINFMLSIYLTRIIGVSGPIWGSAISLFLISPILVFYCFKKIKTLEESLVC